MEINIEINDVINFLGDQICEVRGQSGGVMIKYLKAPQDVDQYTLDWINASNANKQKLVEQTKAKVVLVDKDVQYTDSIAAQGKVLLYVNNPKLTVAQVASRFFEVKYKRCIDKTATIHPMAMIGKGVYIGPNSTIGHCHLGDNIEIHGNVFVYDNVSIGNNVEIHAGAVIGCEAHNYITDERGQKVKFPHLGKVVLDDNVSVGSNSVICRGVLNDTIVSRGTKIAQCVLIGANNRIGSNCAIRGGAKIAGSVQIGDDTIIGLSAMIRDKVVIGAGAVVGMGAVVTKAIPDRETWIGNPARKMS